MDRSLRLNVLICVILAAMIVLVYWQLPGHDFINFDDNVYVTENQRVRSGFRVDGILWAFTSFEAEFWHPLTWLSYFLDYQIFGLNSVGFLATNLLIHIVNTILLFFVFKEMTGRLWHSTLVAILFAIHPLHVESVAWISARKDLLSGMFWFLTMWSYARYTFSVKIRTYIFTLLFFTLGLMSKPMLVTLPFVMLLMDYWPLGRVKYFDQRRDPDKNHIRRAYGKHSVLFLIREKIPFFMIAVLFSIIAFLAQKTAGGVGSFNDFPVGIRISNGLISYILYLFKTAWPHNLAIFYPYPETLNITRASISFIFILFISILSYKWGRRYPFFPVGWLWYMGTLVPVIGIIKIGAQSMADRYTYIPLTGIFIILIWGWSESA